jgi:putative transcriptional regulator
MRNKVKEKRLDKGLTQEMLAESCGVSRQTIISIENEKYEPTTRLAIKISRRLKHRVEELFFLDEEN